MATTHNRGAGNRPPNGTGQSELEIVIAAGECVCLAVDSETGEGLGECRPCGLGSGPCVCEGCTLRRDVCTYCGDVATDEAPSGEPLCSVCEAVATGRVTPERAPRCQHCGANEWRVRFTLGASASVARDSVRVAPLDFDPERDLIECATCDEEPEDWAALAVWDVFAKCEPGPEWADAGEAAEGTAALLAALDRVRIAREGGSRG